MVFLLHHVCLLHITLNLVDLTCIFFCLNFELLEIFFGFYGAQMSTPQPVKANPEHKPIEKHYFREIINTLIKSLHVVDWHDLTKPLFSQRYPVHLHLSLVEQVSHSDKGPIAVCPSGRILKLGPMLFAPPNDVVVDWP